MSFSVVYKGEKFWFDDIDIANKFIELLKEGIAPKVAFDAAIGAKKNDKSNR